jgi:Na+/citrate or Na+/malate symporter
MITVPLWACILAAIWIVAWINMSPSGDYDLGPAFAVIFGIIASLLVWIGYLWGWL